MQTWNCSARVQIKTKTISCSQLLQNRWIIKQTVVLLWKSWRKYGSVSYLFSWTSQEISCEIKPFSIRIQMWFQNGYDPIVWRKRKMDNINKCHNSNLLFSTCAALATSTTTNDQTIYRREHIQMTPVIPHWVLLYSFESA